MDMKYCMPTRVLSGADCLSAYRPEFAAFGKKALIVTGSSSAKANGSLDDAVGALEANGQGHAVFDRVPANPGVECVYEGAAFARAEGCDFVIAIGGGSPMDAAKVIALLARADIPEAELFAGKYGNDILPIVCVPTTAGTGSEVTQYAIITNDAAETKSGIATPLFFPRLALLDAKYLESVPRKTMVNTVIDSLSHSVEGMLSNRASEVTDTLAAKGLSLVAECLPDLASDALTHAQLERLLLASAIGGMVIANTGTTSLHAMGYSLTYFRHIDHGRANGLLLAACLRHAQERRPALVRRIIAPLGMATLADLSLALDRLLGEREKIDASEFEKYADKAAASKNIGNCAVAPSRDEILSIFVESFSRKRYGAAAETRHAAIEYASLEEFIPAAHFRTILPRLRDVPPGVTEISVELELSPRFAATVDVPVTWDGKVYGFVHDNDRLKSAFSGKMAKRYEDRRAFLNDWGDDFLMTLENGARDCEATFFVTADEVRYLFGNCRVLREERAF
jgi:alcohol dehydrogenase class IV